MNNHHPYCDTMDKNIDGIRKPCNCPLGWLTVEAAKAFVGTDKIADCIHAIKSGYGYMEVSFGPRRVTITRVEHRDESANSKPTNGGTP